MMPRVPFIRPVLRDRFLIHIGGRTSNSNNFFFQFYKEEYPEYRGAYLELQLVDAQDLRLEVVQELWRVRLGVAFGLRITRLKVVGGEVGRGLPRSLLQNDAVQPVHVPIRDRFLSFDTEQCSNKF